MFLEHDFYSNFSQSLQSGDARLTNDIIADELSELIVHDYEKVFDLLSKVGINVSKKISDEQLVNILLEKIKTNEKLVRGLSFLISEKNGLINSNTDDKSGKKYVDYVNKNLSSSFDKILKNDNETKKFRTELMNRIKSKDSKVAERRRNVETPSKFWRNTIIIAGVSVAVYLVWKNWGKISGNAPLTASNGTTIPEAVIDTTAKQSPSVSMTPTTLGQTGTTNAQPKTP